MTTMTPKTLQYLWLSVAITLAIVTTACITVPLGILTSPKARRNPFNLYLVFLMVPDVFFTGMCTITCSLNFSKGEYYSAAMCKFQNWYTVFGVSGNAWLNCVIAYQLHKMLRYSHARRRYHSPARKVVALQAVAVYVYSALIASVGTFFAVSPEASDALMEGAIACFPTKYESALFFWLFFAPAMFMVPLVVILWICLDVYRRGLLPNTGRTRLLAIYFFRLVTIFVVMWIPYFIITMVSSDPWLLLVGGMWGHLQIVASALFSVTKPDIRRAVMELLRCAQRVPNEGGDEEESKQRRATWGLSFTGISIFSRASTSMKESTVLAALSSGLDGTTRDDNTTTIAEGKSGHEEQLFCDEAENHNEGKDDAGSSATNVVKNASGDGRANCLDEEDYWEDETSACSPND